MCFVYTQRDSVTYYLVNDSRAFTSKNITAWYCSTMRHLPTAVLKDIDLLIYVHQ